MIRAFKGLDKLLFLLANVVGIALIYACLIYPVTRFWADQTEALADQRTALQRLKSIAGSQKNVEDFAASVKTELGNGAFISGANDGVISAILETNLKTLAESANAKVRSLRALPAGSAGNLPLIGVRLDMTASNKALNQTITSIEAATPLLIIRNATIRPNVANAILTEEPQIDAQFDIFAMPRLNDEAGNR